MCCQFILFPVCRNLQLQNVEIIVGDISTFEMEASFDRIFSIEMFEVKAFSVLCDAVDYDVCGHLFG